jgi:hypothetical protein
MSLSRKGLVWALPALLVVFTPACGKDDNSDDSLTGSSTTTATTSSTGTATVTVALSPDPVSASASPDGGYSWTGAFTATLSNTNTTPITINSITADLQQSSGGIVITPLPDTDESFRFVVAAPHNRVDTNGNMAIPFTFFYSLPNRGREALVTLTFSVTTDEGATGSVSGKVKLQ